jgi:tripartite-type tricarboxylate transporter receptor subunit TctC
VASIRHAARESAPSGPGGAEQPLEEETNMIARRIFRIAAAIAFAGTAAGTAAAYPERPIRLVVPFPPGGTTDVVARVIAPKVGEILKGTVVVDNRGGAGGSIATDLVAQARADGHTLLMATNSHTVNPFIYKNLAFDTAKDFAPVALVADTPALFAAHPSVPAGTLKEFVALAGKSDPPLRYGSAGPGSFPHLATELFMEMARIRMTHIPYKGAAPALTDLLGGQYHVKIEGAVTGVPHYKAGRLKAYGVTSKERLPQLPDLPAVAEQGYPDYESTFWMAIFAPAGTPREVVAALERAFIEAVRSKDIGDKLEGMSTRVLARPASALEQMVKRELAQWPAIVKRTGVSAQ